MVVVLDRHVAHYALLIAKVHLTTLLLVVVLDVLLLAQVVAQPDVAPLVKILQKQLHVQIAVVIVLERVVIHAIQDVEELVIGHVEVAVIPVVKVIAQRDVLAIQKEVVPQELVLEHAAITVKELVKHFAIAHALIWE